MIFKVTKNGTVPQEQYMREHKKELEEEAKFIQEQIKKEERERKREEKRRKKIIEGFHIDEHEQEELKFHIFQP